MTIFVDTMEPAAVASYIEGFGIPTKREGLNKPAVPPRPDYGLRMHDGSWLGISRKQAGEYIGGMDACERQLLDEMEGCDYMALLIEGRFKAAPHGGCYTYEYTNSDVFKINPRKPEMAYGHMGAMRHHYYVDYKHVREQIARYWLMGIEVIETEDMEDSALAMVSLYRECQKATSPTFRRLIPEKYRLDEPDAARKSFALKLMGACPGVGEEIALALAEGGFSTIHQVVRHFDQWEVPPPTVDIAKLPLRSGKRVVGKAAVERIRSGLGC